MTVQTPPSQTPPLQTTPFLAAPAAPALLGQTVVLIGGSAGIGLETARLARSAGAEVVLAGRDPERLERAAQEIGTTRTAAFDAADPAALTGFLRDLPGPVDHVLVTAGGAYYAPLAELDFDRAHRDVDDHLWLALHLAQAAPGRVRPGGTLLFMSGTGGRRTGPGLSLIRAMTAALPALVANLAVEIAPIRVNLIAAGFVDTPLSARLLGEDLDARREQLRETLPIGRVVQPADVAALAVHLMTNTALTGATYDVDGGQQLV
jgi:NAD(P)-dependent dehydrogenase (short-subunit alcohol dehydrogenase family)